MNAAFEPPTPREPACHTCGPHPHHLMPCDLCLCPGDFAPGVDTALRGAP